MEAARTVPPHPRPLSLEGRGENDESARPPFSVPPPAAAVGKSTTPAYARAPIDRIAIFRYFSLGLAALFAGSAKRFVNLLIRFAVPSRSCVAAVGRGGWGSPPRALPFERCLAAGDRSVLCCALLGAGFGRY